MGIDINQYGPMSGRQIIEGNTVVNIADAIRRQQYFNPIEIAINRERNYDALTNNMFTYASYSAIATVETLLKDNLETTILMSASTTLTIVSTSTADVTVTGTGAGAVTIIGLNSVKEQAGEIVLLNGTTPVTTVTEFFRLNRAIVVSAGSTVAPTGTIYIGEGAIVEGKPTIIYGVVNPGVGTMRQLRISTPVNYYAMIAQLITTVGIGKDVVFSLKAKYQDTGWLTAAVFDNYQTAVYFTLPIPQDMGELVDLELLVQADKVDVRGSAYLILTLIHSSLVTQTFDLGI